MFIFFFLADTYRYQKRVSLDQEVMVNLKIEDPFGWRLPLPFSYYNPIDVFIVVYDITQRDSFADAKTLVYEFTRKTRPGAFVALVGNKADLEGRREVSFKVSNVAMFI